MIEKALKGFVVGVLLPVASFIWTSVLLDTSTTAEASTLPDGWVTTTGQITNLSDDGASFWWQPDCAEGVQCISGGRVVEVPAGQSVVVGQAYTLTYRL